MHALRDFVADLQHALRQMRRRPGFTAVAILTVGLGIGATVAFSSVANSVILRSLPYADEARIHVFWMQYWWRGDEYDFVRERPGVFEHLAAYSDNAEPYTTDPRSTDGARLLPLVVATPSLFDVLGVHAERGQLFGPADDRPGAPPVIVISHAMWQDELGGDPNVIGRQIWMSGTPVTIVGVMPAGFYFPTPNTRAWKPLQLDPSGQQYANVGYLVVTGRAKPGVTPPAVDADVHRIARELGQRFTYTQAGDKTRDPRATPVREYLLGSLRDPIVLLLVAVALVLLIAAANTAALVLARTSDRSQEMAVRTALGADGWRLVRQIVAESLALSLAAAAVGAVVAAAGFQLLVTQLPFQNGLGATLTPGLAVPAVAFALALAIGGAIAIAPARALLRRGLDGGLSRERSGEGLRRGTRRAHAWIVGAQVSFAIVLAVGAALLIRSVDRILAIDPGFDARQVTTFTLVTPSDGSPAARHQFVRDVIARVAALPGVSAAGVTNRLPLRDGGFQGNVTIEGRPDLDGPRRPNALYRIASADYFRSMGMRVVEGRGIDSTDTEATDPVTVVTETFARKMWPGESAIGKHVTTGWTGKLLARRVVGVAKEPRFFAIVGDNPLAMFIPFEQDGARTNGAILTVRSTVPPAALVPIVRRTIGAIDATVAVARVQTMEDVVAMSLAQPLRLRFFLGVFAALAIVLSAVGVYGTVSYAVARRRGEFGILLALGATPSRVLGEVVRRALAPVVIGAAAGLAVAIVGAGAIRGFLYGVAPTDLPSLAVAGVVLVGTGAIAALAPALRASRTSPAESLRAE